jgi:KDO2-lipid IV(A) lauroyltransferase
VAQLALRFNAEIIPARVERTSGANFRLTVFPPVELARTGDRQADTREVMRRVNAVIESWIRERPEQWFWLHRRWPD